MTRVTEITELARSRIRRGDSPVWCEQTLIDAAALMDVLQAAYLLAPEGSPIAKFIDCYIAADTVERAELTPGGKYTALHALVGDIEDAAEAVAGELTERADSWWRETA